MPKEAENKRKSITKNFVRLDGKDEYKTNDKTLEEVKYTKVGVVDERNFPDALASSPLTLKREIGIQLVDGSKAYMPTHKVVYTYGGADLVKQVVVRD